MDHSFDSLENYLLLLEKYFDVRINSTMYKILKNGTCMLVRH